MKYPILISIMASVTALQAQMDYTEYSMPSIGTKPYKIQVDEDGDLYVTIQSLDDVSKSAGIIIRKNPSTGFVDCMDSAKKKYSEWKSVAVQNRVKQLRKPIECTCTVDGYFSYGDWQLDFGKTPTFLFLVSETKGKVTHSLVVVTGKMTSSSNKYINMDGAAMSFDSENEIEGFLSKIRPEAVQKFLDKPKTEDLFR